MGAKEVRNRFAKSVWLEEIPQKKLSWRSLTNGPTLSACSATCLGSFCRALHWNGSRGAVRSCRRTYSCIFRNIGWTSKLCTLVPNLIVTTWGWEGRSPWCAGTGTLIKFSTKGFHVKLHRFLYVYLQSYTFSTGFT